MTNSSLSPGGRWLPILQQGITFLFLAYVLILLGRSAWQNGRSNRRLAELRTEIDQLRADNDRLSYLIVYQQTDSFKELEARRKLGLKKPGEIVLALPPEPEPSPDEVPRVQVAVQTTTTLRLWWDYYFSQER